MSAVALATVVYMAHAVQAPGFVQTLESMKLNKFLECLKTQENAFEEIAKHPGPFTIFVPTDAALNSWQGLAEYMKPENKRKLRQVLKYHVVPGELTVAQCGDRGRLVTASGDEVNVKGNTINGATITQKDIKISNGIVNVIDKVLIPKAP